jgi:dephospho-CoA kinase
MISLALTGSIGMGKSTVAAMFADAGIPTFDADAVVRELQGPGGRLVPLIEARFPGTTRDGAVDREALSAAVLPTATNWPRWKRSSIRLSIMNGPGSLSNMAMRRAAIRYSPAVRNRGQRSVRQGHRRFATRELPARAGAQPSRHEPTGKLAQILSRQIPDEEKTDSEPTLCRYIRHTGPNPRPGAQYPVLSRLADGCLRRSMREIVFDTETTGLSPAGGDRMVEIGCIEMIGRIETGRHFHCYFNPSARCRARPRRCMA